MPPTQFATVFNKPPATLPALVALQPVFCGNCGIDLMGNPATRITGAGRPVGASEPNLFDISCDCGATVQIEFGQLHVRVSLLGTAGRVIQVVRIVGAP